MTKTPNDLKPVALVSMPTLSAQFPSFQLGLLKPTLENAGIKAQSFSMFMYFAERIGFRLNEALALVYPSMVGEWIWAKAAWGEFADDRGYFERYGDELRGIAEGAGCTLEDLVRVRDEETFAFLDYAVDAVDWSRFGMVGFTVVFQQMLSSVALARRLKAKHPDLPIVFGGATFEDDIASELMKGCAEIDVVHCGDADLTLPELCRRVQRGESLSGLKGVMWRKDGVVTYEGRAPNLEQLDKTPVPDFDEYFYARSEASYDSYEGARAALIPIETARGCWYGMKNHCTFCGLNRSGMDFRAKSPDDVLSMLEALQRKYGTFQFNAIDNILAPEYATKLFGKLSEAKTDYRLHYEIRPVIGRAQLRNMHDGGLVSVQPGVESFSTHVLGLMKKHTTGARNLELIKWTTYFGITNLYNILYGFPGETESDYALQADLFRKIVHLEPPTSFCQARPDRGSPMFEEPDKHQIHSLKPTPCYPHLYPEDRFDLRRISYYFEHEIGGILPAGGYDECTALVEEWQARWNGENRPYLRYRRSLKSLVIEDGRGDEPSEHVLFDRDAELYELCADAKRKEDLAAHFKGDVAWAEATLSDLIDRGLLVHLDDRYLALALPVNSRM